MLKSALTFLMFLSFITQAAFAEEPITMVAGESFPPLMWDNKGVPSGIAVEIGEAILKKAGFKVTVVSCPWKRCQILAEKEGAFITGFAKNAERQQKFLYSNVIMYDDLVIVTKKGKEFSLSVPKEYKGKVIGAQMGVGYGENNQGLRDGMVIETDSDDVSRVKKIMFGRIDGGFFSLGKIGINYSAKLAGYKLEDFSILPVIVSKDPNYLATGKKTPNGADKIKRINTAIKAMNKSGELTKILKKYF